MEPSSIKCHACSTQYTPNGPYLCFFSSSTILSLHHSSPLQVIPKQNLSIHDSLWRDMFKASLKASSVNSQPLSFSPVLVKPPTQSPSPNPKRCLWIFNGAIVPVCVPVNGEHWLGVHTFWSTYLGALETATRTAGQQGWRQWGGQMSLTLTCCT